MNFKQKLCYTTLGAAIFFVGMLAANLLSPVSSQGPPRSYTMSVEEKISEWRSYIIILIGFVVASGIIVSIFMIPLQLDNIKQILANIRRNRLQYQERKLVERQATIYDANKCSRTHIRNIILVGNFGFFKVYPFIKTCGLVRMCSRWTNRILLFQGFSFLAHSIVFGKKNCYLGMYLFFLSRRASSSASQFCQNSRISAQSTLDCLDDFARTSWQNAKAECPPTTRNSSRPRTTSSPTLP